jgi:hypothetical protein
MTYNQQKVAAFCLSVLVHAFILVPLPAFKHVPAEKKSYPLEITYYRLF